MGWKSKINFNCVLQDESVSRKIQVLSKQNFKMLIIERKHMFFPIQESCPCKKEEKGMKKGKD